MIRGNNCQGDDLQFLDGVSRIEKYTEYPMEETINRLLAYAPKMQFKRD